MPRNHTDLTLQIIAIVTLAIFLSLTFGFGGNSQCLKYLGCNMGFFGFDAVWHFFGGIFIASTIVLIERMFPRLDFFQEDKLKNYIIFIALVVMIAVGWEMLEFTHDHVLGEIPYVRDIKILELQSVAQPSNPDTMGDLFFDIWGGLAASLFI